jgi:Ca2+-binding RTX toxin-like protein
MATIGGGASSDSLHGTSGADVIFGNGGDDLILGGRERCSLRGDWS